MIYIYLNVLALLIGLQSMKINYNREHRGGDRARQLGLASRRFQETHMGSHAKEDVEYVKSKDRSYLKLNQWRQKHYYKSDATLQLRNCPDDIQRRDAESLSVQEFISKYQKLQRPVIIRGCTQNWNTDKLSFQSLYQNYKDYKFKVGEDDDGYKLRMPLKHYLQYLIYNKDDSPLYLFQSSLRDHKQASGILQHYRVPPYFRDDLFKLAGQKKRPPYQWMIIGPQRSGTTVHIDPLHTSAWNTSLAGYKRWILFGASIPKTIVKGKQFRDQNYQDQAINYFVQILPKIKQKYSRKELEIMEFIQGPGETVFVPGGLWHAVINLTDTMAVTQNVMTHQCFDKVWRSTRCERPKFGKFFLEKLQQQNESLYKKALALNQQDEFIMGQRYCKQSVSLSFSSSSRSSSSSSSKSSSSEKKSRKRLDSAEKASNKTRNKVELREQLVSARRSHSRSRTREKRRQNRSQQRNVGSLKRDK